MPFPLLRPYTRKARFLVALIQRLGYILRLFRGRAWSRPLPFFTDDSSRYTLRDLLFFSWKYYCHLLVKDDAGDRAEAHFRQVNFDIAPLPLPLTESVVMHAGGDLMPYSWIRPEFCRHLWADIGDDFFSADLRVANLETPVRLDQPLSLVPEVMLDEMLFNADEAMFDLFNGGNPEYSFDLLSTANNHSLDMGPEGVLGTLDFLRKKGIAAVGTAASPEEALQPVYLERKGIRFAFLAWTYSLNKCICPEDQPWLVNHIPVNEARPDISPIAEMARVAKQEGKADILILCLHYGNGYQAFPGAHIRETTRRIFESCGIDLILGSHPHNMQPMESVDFGCPWSGADKKGWVIYSLADFVAFDIYTLCHMPVWLQVRFDKYQLGAERHVQIGAVGARPIYLAAHYVSEHKRDLRMVDALRLEQRIRGQGKPEWLDAAVLPEFEGLMAYYRHYFNAPAFDLPRA